jgi:hypothetical protein
MILFIGPNPETTKLREGFLQRIAAIDKIFSDSVRVYSGDLKSQRELIDSLAEADAVYVHSIYKAEEILSFYPTLSQKIITDLHGVVPEELNLIGNQEASQIMARIEKEVFKYGKYFVGMTNAMTKYYTKKYRLTDSVQWIVLPMTEVFHISQARKKVNNKNVIYVGGAQAWQNTPLITKAIHEDKRDIEYTVLTHDIPAFASLKGTNCDIRTVSSSEVGKFYQQARLGFILRNDIIINRVSCPIKLVEYMSNGVVPIVLSPNIGDFLEIGYAYIKYNDFLNRIPSDEELEEMVKVNNKTISKLQLQTRRGVADLQKTIGLMHKKQAVVLKDTIHELSSLQRQISCTKEQLDQTHEVLKIYKQESISLRQTLEELRSSRSWKLARRISKMRMLWPIR